MQQENKQSEKSNVYSQYSYRCRIDWGRHGTQEAAARGDILVIVDTLSFSSSVVTAIAHGGIIYPCSWEDEDPVALAQRIGGIAALRRRQNVPARGRFSLSPITFLQIQPGERVVLASPNGATCSRYAGHVPYLLVGTLLNAQATAATISALLAHSDLNVTVIACGERWRTPTPDGELRIAIEDYLGAGAILSYLAYEKSPEASVCAGAFKEASANLEALLWDCGSGRELRAVGYSDDVVHSARLNIYQTTPIMQGDHMIAFSENHIKEKR